LDLIIGTGLIVASQANIKTASISLGYQAGQNSQFTRTIAMGYQAGQNTQGSSAIAIGFQAGQATQGGNAIAIGYQAGRTNQRGSAIAIGSGAGQYTQSNFAVSIGSDAGKTNQGDSAISIGKQSGNYSQGSDAVSIGSYSQGCTNQGLSAVGIGVDAGAGYQSDNAIAIGYEAGKYTQGNSAISIGSNAGTYSQGVGSIAIGNNAGYSGQASNSVVINASGNELNGANSGFYAAPIRNTDPLPDNILYYDSTNCEIVYGAAPSIPTNVVTTSGNNAFTGTNSFSSGLNVSSGNVLIGTTTASSVPLYVETSASYTPSGGFLTSIAAAGAINSSTAFIQGSDKRIKTNVNSIEGCVSLELLAKLEPRTYSLVDISKNYLSKTYGFIAQEVESVLPEAASPIVDFVPNIYELADVVGDMCVIKLRNKSTCDFEKDASGNLFKKLKYYDCCNNEFLAEIVYIIDDKTFQVLNPISSVGGSIFIYGQEVENFKCLDKNVIFTVTTAAAQALHRIVQTQQSEIDSLKKRLEYIETLLIGNV
jgi:hypothetical protein